MPKAAQAAWWPWLAAGVLTAGGLLVVATLNLPSSPVVPSSATLGLAPPSPGPRGPIATTAAAPSLLPTPRLTTPTRVALAPSAARESQLAPLTTIPSILERIRQIKTEILDRALAVVPEDIERFKWLENLPGTGIVRLLDRAEYGAAFSLPWMREGGAYFSFTESVHDFNRRPQISYSHGFLWANSRERAALDFGPMSLDSVGTDPRGMRTGLSPVKATEFDLAWTKVDPAHPQLKTLADHRAHAVEIARLREGASTPDVKATSSGNPGSCVRARAGHSFLMRLREPGQYDVLIAFEVVRAQDDGCTLAWRTLETWPVEDERSLWKPRMQRSELRKAPAQMTAMSTVELRQELAHALADADEQLFQSFPADIETRFGQLRAQSQAGLARLLPYMGQWTELRNGRAHGSTLSPFHQVQDGQKTYLGFEGSGRYANLHPGLDGGVFGIVADIGKVDLETVTRASVTGLGGASGDIALNHTFDQLPYEPNRPNFDRERGELRQTNRTAFHATLQEHNVRETAVAVVGRTYLVRAIRFAERDALFAVHVAALDQYGAIVAWRVLESEVAEPME